MPELPSGTVTFLFTDIEGSTRLLKQLRDRYGDVLVGHQRLLRAAFGEAGGREIDTQGDAFFFAFATAKNAVAAALAGQRVLAGHAWPDGADVRVRMGIHTGEPALGGERYVGLGVHRAARICAAAHGGQTLLSDATRAVAEDELPDGVALRELGEHELKDLDRPERLYQLLAPDLPSEFPPLRTGQEETAFAGREDELAEAARAAVAGPRPLRRRTLLLAALAGVLAAAVAIPIFALGQGGESVEAVTVRPNSVAVIDPDSNEVVADVPVGAEPTNIAVGEGAVWVLNSRDLTVSRIDPETFEARSMGTGATPSDLAVGGGGVWLVTPCPGTTVLRIDPASNTVERVLELPPACVEDNPSFIAYYDDALWVAVMESLVVFRIDPEREAVTTTIRRANQDVGGIAVGEGAVWVNASPVTRIDPASNSSSTIEVPHRFGGVVVGGIAAGEGGVWATSAGDGLVWRLDTRRGVVDSTIRVGDGPLAVAVGGGSVWTADNFAGTVSRIDPSANEVVKTIEVGNPPRGIAVGYGLVWVTVG